VKTIANYNTYRCRIIIISIIYSVTGATNHLLLLSILLSAFLSRFPLGTFLAALLGLLLIRCLALVSCTHFPLRRQCGFPGGPSARRVPLSSILRILALLVILFLIRGGISFGSTARRCLFYSLLHTLFHLLCDTRAH
jgi:hypothetical protein